MSSSRTMHAPLLALVLMAAAAGQAHAQRIDSPYRFLDERQSAEAYVARWSTRPGTIGLAPRPATGFGVRYTIQVGGAFVLEGDLGYLPTERDVLTTDTLTQEPDSVPDRTVVGTADLAILMAQLNLRFNLTGPRTWNGLQPYLLLGGGLAADLTGDVDADDDVPAGAVFDFGTSFAGQLGAGIEWFPRRGIGVRADVRDVLWKIETPVAFLGPRVPTDEWVQNPVFSLALAIHF